MLHTGFFLLLSHQHLAFLIGGEADGHLHRICRCLLTYPLDVGAVDNGGHIRERTKGGKAVVGPTRQLGTVGGVTNDGEVVAHQLRHQLLLDAGNKSAAFREGLHLGIEHAAGGFAMPHQRKGDPIVGIEARMEGILLHGSIDGVGIGGGEGVQFAIGGMGVVGQHFLARYPFVLTGTGG